MSVRERVKASPDWETKEIDADKWGTLTIRSLSAKEKLELAAMAGDGELNNEQAVNFYCKLVVIGVVEDGKPAFTDQDIEWLVDKNWGTIEKVADAVLDFNGMSKSSIEEAAKN